MRLILEATYERKVGANKREQKSHAARAGGSLTQALTAKKTALEATNAAAKHEEATGNPIRSTSCAPNN